MGKLIDKDYIKAKVIHSRMIDAEYKKTMAKKTIEPNPPLRRSEEILDNNLIMQPKPIFTVGVPKTLPIEELIRIKKSIEVKLDDYHVLCYYVNNADTPVFNAYFPKDFDDILFNDLKSKVHQAINHPDLTDV